MTNKLRLALDREELVLHYQARVDLASGRVTAVEALIRWQHPEDGLIYPAQFAPLAKEAGMIESIGAWVLEESCKQAKAWLDAGIGPLRIAVNLSARQFRQAELLEHIPTLLAKTGLTPQYLELEITESMMMQDLERSEQILAQLNG